MTASSIKFFEKYGFLCLKVLEGDCSPGWQLHFPVNCDAVSTRMMRNRGFNTIVQGGVSGTNETRT